jgi:hypothetical protein
VSGLLQHITADFDRRLAVRRAMFAHLSIDIPEDRAAEVQADLRETLLACARCTNPGIPAGWVAQGRDGMPLFCHAREAFLRLEAMADSAPEPIRLNA